MGAIRGSLGGRSWGAKPGLRRKAAAGR